MSGIGLALGGGSSKGLSHIGVLKALQEANIQITHISGTSMGAVVGAIYAASQDLSNLTERAKRITSSKAFRDLGFSAFKREEEGKLQKIAHMIREKLLFAEALFKPYLVDEREVMDALKQIIPDMDIEDMAIPFATVSLDLISGFDIVRNKGSLRDAVMSSMAIPGLFQFSEKDGTLLVDGGATSGIPVYAAHLLGAETVMAVSLRGDLEKRKRPASGLEIHLRIDEIVVTRLLEMQTEKADIVIRPDVSDVHWADFSRIEYCILKGYEATQAVLPRIRSILRKKSSFPYRLGRLFRKSSAEERRYQKVLT
jgi:NTE family protein